MTDDEILNYCMTLDYNSLRKLSESSERIERVCRNELANRKKMIEIADREPLKDYPYVGPRGGRYRLADPNNPESRKEYYHSKLAEERKEQEIFKRASILPQIGRLGGLYYITPSGEYRHVSRQKLPIGAEAYL